MKFKSLFLLFVVTPLLALTAYVGYLVVAAPPAEKSELGKGPRTFDALVVETVKYHDFRFKEALSSSLKTIAQEMKSRVSGSDDDQAGNVRDLAQELESLSEDPESAFEIPRDEFHDKLNQVHLSLAKFHALRAAMLEEKPQLKERNEQLRMAAVHIRRSLEMQSGDLSEFGRSLQSEMDQFLDESQVFSSEVAEKGKEFLDGLNDQIQQLQDQIGFQPDQEEKG